MLFKDVSGISTLDHCGFGFPVRMIEFLKNLLDCCAVCLKSLTLPLRFQESLPVID